MCHKSLSNHQIAFPTFNKILIRISPLGRGLRGGLIVILSLVCIFTFTNGCANKSKEEMMAQSDFVKMVTKLKTAFPKHFLGDAIIAESNDIERPMVFGEPEPPEGFAGPDPTGKHKFGIYVPVDRDKYFKEDISLEQWIFHEMFHLHNRRIKDYESFIDKAFPDENDPLVQWIKKDLYHQTFAREEAFINLITFADPSRTESQKEAIREWFDYIGAKDKSIEEIKSILNVIPHW